LQYILKMTEKICFKRDFEVGGLEALSTKLSFKINLVSFD